MVWIDLCESITEVVLASPGTSFVPFPVLASERRAGLYTRRAVPGLLPAAVGTAASNTRPAGGFGLMCANASSAGDLSAHMGGLATGRERAVHLSRTSREARPAPFSSNRACASFSRLVNTSRRRCSP